MDAVLKVGTWNLNSGSRPGEQAAVTPGDFRAPLEGANFDVLLLQEVPLFAGELARELAIALELEGLATGATLELSRAHNRPGYASGLGVFLRGELHAIRSWQFPNPGLVAMVEGQRWTSHDKGLVTAMVKVRGWRWQFSSVHLLPLDHFGIERRDSLYSETWKWLADGLRASFVTGSGCVIGGDFNRNVESIDVGDLQLVGLVRGDQTRTSGSSHDNLLVPSGVDVLDVEILPTFSDHHLVSAIMRLHKSDSEMRLG